MIERLNPRIHVVGEGTKTKTTGLNKLFSEIIAENFPSPGDDTVMQVQGAFRISNRNVKSLSVSHYIHREEVARKNTNLLSKENLSE